jgi:GNAT superfamily N-acetyltransferase
MTLEILERDFDSFFAVPFNVYGRETEYVSPLRGDLKKMLQRDLNPLFSKDDEFTYFSARRAGQACGRIVVHEHRASNELYGTKRASFGFFDCENDTTTARLLLDAAKHWARARGFEEIVGNFNLTAMQQCGIQIDGFSRCGYTDMVQNPPHIPKLLKANGFAPYFPMTTFELDVPAANRTGKVLAEADGFTFAPVKKRAFAERLEEARIVLNDGFASNPMFVPLSAAEFDFQAGEMTAILDPRLSSVVHKNGDPVGVVICIPDINGFLKATRSRIGLMTPFHFLRYRLNRKRAVIIFYSVSSSQHGQGIMGAMLDRTLNALQRAGYEKLGITWIADVNPASLRQMEKLGAEPLHKLHLFKAEI